MRRRTKTTITAIVQILLAIIITAGIILLSCSSASAPKTLHILSTNDIHGSYFSDSFRGGNALRSLQNVKWYVDSIRVADGANNVLLIDVGDALQGETAAYYYNQVDTKSEHIYTREVAYMGYDAVVCGNHDIEAGHAVFDRVASSLSRKKIPFLGGNVRGEDGKLYFPEYKVFKRAGKKVLVMGYTHPNVTSWVNESLRSGMTFESLRPLVQQRVDALKSTIKPDVTVVCVHSEDGGLFDSLTGIDVLLTAHDHKPVVRCRPDACLMNSGSHCRYLAHAAISFEGDKKNYSAELVKVRPEHIDWKMKEKFLPDFITIRKFTNQKVGELEKPLFTNESYKGMCFYSNLLHTVQLKTTGAQISFSAPLTYNRKIREGQLVYNDMFTIYPYENQLCKIKLTGKQIKDYLEYSYDLWLDSSQEEHLLRIKRFDDPRTGQKGWSFQDRFYNFDSAAGLNYEVFPFAERGERIVISSLSDGKPFSESETYSVALTSYRANGGGGHLVRGAGIRPEDLPSLVIGKYPEMRTLIYDYIKENGKISPSAVGEEKLLGEWKFSPEAAQAKINEDWKLLFE